MRNVYAAEYRMMLNRLIAARKARGLTQMEVARRLGIPQPRISLMETGERRIDVIELAHFARLYRKKLSYFVPGF